MERSRIPSTSKWLSMLELNTAQTANRMNHMVRFVQYVTACSKKNAWPSDDADQLLVLDWVATGPHAGRPAKNDGGTVAREKHVPAGRSGPEGGGKTQISEVSKLEGFFGRLPARLARSRGVLRPPRCASCWRPPNRGEAALRSSALGVEMRGGILSRRRGPGHPLMRSVHFAAREVWTSLSWVVLRPGSIVMVLGPESGPRGPHNKSPGPYIRHRASETTLGPQRRAHGVGFGSQ